MLWQTICDILHIRGSFGPDFGDTIPTCEEVEIDANMLHADVEMGYSEQELEDALDFWEHLHDYDY